jgi:hypothetical protein
VRGFNDILFSSSCKLVHVVQIIKATSSGVIRPANPNQLESCRDHEIPVAIQSRVDKHIASRRAYTTVISRFLEAASQHNVA